MTANSERQSEFFVTARKVIFVNILCHFLCLVWAVSAYWLDRIFQHAKYRTNPVSMVRRAFQINLTFFWRIIG